jgi:hypothetical protein
VFCEGIVNRGLKHLADTKCQVLGISHKKKKPCMVLNHLKELIQFADHSSVKFTVNLLMIFQSLIQKSQKMYSFTINSQPLSHYQKVFKKVDHQNVTDVKTGNVLPAYRDISLLYSVSVWFMVF